MQHFDHGAAALRRVGVSTGGLAAPAAADVEMVQISVDHLIQLSQMAQGNLQESFLREMHNSIVVAAATGLSLGSQQAAAAGQQVLLG